MPTPDMQHVAHRQEARIEDQEFARSLTLKEKNDFQKLLMKAYAATVEVSSIPLVEGDATATIESPSGLKEMYTLRLGESFRVGKGAVHRLESKKGGVIVEVALGHFDEDDIVRLEDDHGRAPLEKTLRRKTVRSTVRSLTGRVSK